MSVTDIDEVNEVYVCPICGSGEVTLAGLKHVPEAAFILHCPSGHLFEMPIGENWAELRITIGFKVDES